MKPFICALKTDETQTGIAISEHMVPMPDDKSPSGIRLTALIGVLWDEQRSPSPSYHDPKQLTWLSVPDIADPEEDEDEEETEEDETEEDGLQAGHA